MKLEGIHHITAVTADAPRNVEFYAGVLGLKVIAEDGFATTFDLGGGATMRLTDLPGHTAMGHTVLGWNVPDIRSAANELRDKGVTFTVYEGFGQDADNTVIMPIKAVQRRLTGNRDVRVRAGLADEPEDVAEWPAPRVVEGRRRPDGRTPARAKPSPKSVTVNS